MNNGVIRFFGCSTTRINIEVHGVFWRYHWNERSIGVQSTRTALTTQLAVAHRVFEANTSKRIWEKQRTTESYVIVYACTDVYAHANEREQHIVHTACRSQRRMLAFTLSIVYGDQITYTLPNNNYMRKTVETAALVKIDVYHLAIINKGKFAKNCICIVMVPQFSIVDISSVYFIHCDTIEIRL